jgi:citrate lyase subunit gamma (acyl carrier protein)
MTKIIRSASAGTLESNDVFVEIEPWDQGLQLTLESLVKQQFGDAIERSVRETLAQCGVEQAKLSVVDQGALDCVLRARVETAVARGREGQA